MKVGSLFTGIGGLDEGLRRAGHEHAFMCERNAYRRRVLAARFPAVRTYYDVRHVGRGDRCDLLAGGFPCQDVSEAGTRRGINGDRSALFFDFVRVANAVRPRWLLIENVPGLLASHSGCDFGCVLGELADIGYGVAWRIVNSRYFGVPLRRRRLFIVGSRAADDPERAAARAGAVLAVGSRCATHLGESNRTRPSAALASISGLGTGGADDNDAQAGRLIVQGDRVRTLTAVECERLQGLPDDWTQLGKTKDAPRVLALGDAVTVPVAEWIGRRLTHIEGMT